MKNAPFTYHRPATVDEALALLTEHGDDSKILAGGQSLLPIMALRLARPEHLVDIAHIASLQGIELSTNGDVTIGAMVRHREAERSAVLAQSAPLVHAAMPMVGHRAIRTRGTVVGSIAHADPAAEMPAVALAANATMIVASQAGVREIPAVDFFEGYLQTALAADDILTGVRFPAWRRGEVGTIAEESRRHGDYALLGVACRLLIDDGEIVEAALAYLGAASTPVRSAEAEGALVGRRPGQEAFAAAAVTAARSLSPTADVHGSANYRRHLADVLTRRALEQATSSTGVPA